MKRILQWILVLIPIISFAKTEYGLGTIKGKVTTNDEKPAVNVTVLIKATNKGTVTDENGAFEFSKLNTGTYTLQISLLGYAPVEQTVTVEENKTATLSFQLKLSDNQLEEVVVTGSWNKFAQRKSDYIARMPIKPLENSQVYNTVTKELAQEQLATDFSSVLKNAAGVGGASTTNPIMGRSQLMIRGFSQVFTLKNGMYVNSNFAPDPVTIEKLDVVKGPSATLFGASAYLGMSYGGFVNQQTKKPFETLRGEVGYSAGSYGLNRLTSDINVPLNDGKTALFRLNNALVTENNFKNYGYNKSYTINPSFLYKVTDKLTVRAELDIQYNKRAGNTTINPIGSKVTAKNWKDVRADYYSSYGSDDLPSITKYNDVYLQAEYQISSAWKSQTNYMLSSFNLDWSLISTNLLTDSTLRRSGSARLDHNTITTNIQQNFVGDFHIGKFRNRLLIGGDYSRSNELKQSLYGNTFTIDTVNYLRKKEQTISHFDFNAKAATVGYTNYGGRFSSDIYGLYVCDVFNITDNLLAMAGLRFDMYKDHTGTDIVGNSDYPDNSQNTFAPKFGLIYQPIKDKISIFANYQNGFTNQFGTDREGKRFKPEQANQKEVGVKAELSKGLSGSLSYYDITVKDVLRTDITDPNFSIQDGTQNNKGIEADIIYNPLPGLNMLVGYGHLKSRYVKSEKDVEGKQPANTADNVANFWASYSVVNGKAKGLGIGFGGNYTSDTYVDDLNTFVIPSYALFDATVFYDAKKYRLGFKLNNVANTKTWNRWGSQPLRQFVINLTARF